MCLTLGTYLRKRREAAFLTIEDVASNFSTEPRYAQHVRVELLALIEADVVQPSFMTIVVLGALYPIDMHVLVALAADDRRRPLPPICPGCGCSEGSACIDQIGLAVCSREFGGPCSACRKRVDMLIATVIA